MSIRNKFIFDCNQKRVIFILINHQVIDYFFVNEMSAARDKEEVLPFHVTPKGIYVGIEIDGVETNGAGLFAIVFLSSLILYIADLGIISGLPAIAVMMRMCRESNGVFPAIALSSLMLHISGLGPASWLLILLPMYRYGSFRFTTKAFNQTADAVNPNTALNEEPTPSSTPNTAI